MDKYKVVYDQALDRVKFPPDITAEARSGDQKPSTLRLCSIAGLWTALVYEVPSKLLLLSLATRCFIDIVKMHTTMANDRGLSN